MTEYTAQIAIARDRPLAREAQETEIPQGFFFG